MLSKKKRYLVTSWKRHTDVKCPRMPAVVVKATDVGDAIRAGRQLLGFDEFRQNGINAVSYAFAAHVIPNGSAVFTVTAKKVRPDSRGPETDSLPVSAADEATAVAKGMQIMGLIADRDGE